MTIHPVRMDFPTSIAVLENEIKKLNGVKDVQGNYMLKTSRVTYDAEIVGLSQIEAAIERISHQIAYKRYPTAFSRLKNLIRIKKSNNA
jgi:copper chaperone CopZ